MTQDEDPGTDGDVVPFPQQFPPTSGSSSLAIAITIANAVVELTKLAMLLGVMLLAGLGLGTLVTR
jgi:hypothetical protein